MQHATQCLLLLYGMGPVDHVIPPGVPPQDTFLLHLFQWSQECNKAPSAVLSGHTCASATAALYDVPTARQSHQHPRCNLMFFWLHLLPNENLSAPARYPQTGLLVSKKQHTLLPCPIAVVPQVQQCPSCTSVSYHLCICNCWAIWCPNCKAFTPTSQLQHFSSCTMFQCKTVSPCQRYPPTVLTGLLVSKVQHTLLLCSNAVVQLQVQFLGGNTCASATTDLYDVSIAKHSHQHSSCISTLLSVLCCGVLFCSVLSLSSPLVSSHYVSCHLVRKQFIVWHQSRH